MIAFLPAFAPLGIIRQAASVKKPEPGQLTPVPRDAGPPCAGVPELDGSTASTATPTEDRTGMLGENMVINLHRRYNPPARPQNGRPDAGPSCPNPSSTSGEDWEHDPEPMGPNDPAYR